MAVFEKPTQYAALEYLAANPKVDARHLNRTERKIMKRLVELGKVEEIHKNVGLWSSAGRSWTEYILVATPDSTDGDELFSLQDYEK